MEPLDAALFAPPGTKKPAKKSAVKSLIVAVTLFTRASEHFAREITVLRKLPCRNLLAGLMTASVLAALMTASVFARGTPRAAPTQTSIQGGGGEILEVFSNDGRSVRRLEAAQLSAVVSKAATRKDETGSRGSLLASPEFVASTRARIRQVLAMPLKNRKADFALTLAVLDAMSAASEAEAHQLLARLPIRVERKVGPATVTTSVYVRGNIKFQAMTPLSATDSEGTVTSVSPNDANSPGATDEVNVYAPVAPSISPQSDCEINPDDPCATQQDIDDVLAAEAAMQVDLDSAADDFAADEVACYADGCCQYLPTTSGPAIRTQSCGWKYLEAAGGLAVAAGAITGAVAVTISPDPISKLALFSVYATAAGAVALAVAGVYDAWACHYNILDAPVSWTGLRIDRPEFVLKPVFVGPIGR